MATPSPVLAPIEKREDRVALVLAGSALSLTSGMVNCYAFYELGVLLSHQTGNTCHLSRLVEIELWIKIAAAFFTFWVGSMAAGALKMDFESYLASGRSPGLAFVGVCILVGTAIEHLSDDKEFCGSSICLMGFSQGLQNGITTACKAMPVRTTHMTGALTDSGLLIGQWVAAKVQKTGNVDPWKCTALVLFMVFFFIGGLMQMVAFEKFGDISGYMPAVLTIFCAYGLLGPSVASRRKKAALRQGPGYGTP